MRKPKHKKKIKRQSSGYEQIKARPNSSICGGALSNKHKRPTEKRRSRLSRFVASTPKVVVTAATFISMIVIVTVLFSDIFQKDVVRIEPFVVNSELRNKGYDDDMLPRLFAHKISLMIKEARSVRKSQNFDVPITMNLPDLEVPGAKLSIKNLMRYLQEFPPLHYIRRSFGLNPVRINGVALLEGSTVQINLRITKDVESATLVNARTFAEDLANIDSLVTETSQFILADAEPYLWASYLYQKKRTNEAIAQLEACIHQDTPDQPYLALTLWGLILIDQKKYDVAITKLEEATKYEKPGEFRREFVAAYNNWGLALLSKCQVDDAILKFEEAMRHEPTYALTYNNYAIALLQKGEKDKAIEKLEHSLKLDPNLALAYYNLAYAVSKEKPDDAIALYRRAIGIDSNFVEAYCELGLIMVDSPHPQTEEAMTLLQRAIVIDPNFAAAHSNLGLAWMNKNDTKQAIVEFEKGIKTYAKELPDKQCDQIFIKAYAGTYNNLGWAFETAEDLKAALLNYQNAINIKPNFYLAYIGKGDVLRKMKSFGDALTAYKTVPKEADTQVRFAAYFGEALVFVEKCRRCAPAAKRKDHEQAVSMFEEALKLRPNDPEVLKQLKRL